jgi:hypothetical protein
VNTLLTGLCLTALCAIDGPVAGLIATEAVVAVRSSLVECSAADKPVSNGESRTSIAPQMTFLLSTFAFFTAAGAFGNVVCLFAQDGTSTTTCFGVGRGGEI